MYLSHSENRRRGYTAFNKKQFQPPILSSLLENLRCHSSDEYPIISGDNDSPIPPLACGFSNARNTAHILAVVDENGGTVVYDTNKAGEDAILTDWTAHSNAVFDLKWLCTEEKLLTASGDQTVCLWDVKSANKLLTFKGHTSSVRSLGFRPQDDAVFSSGSRDGHIRLWDVRCNVKDKKVSSVNVIRNAHTLSIQANNKKKKSRFGMTQTQDSQQSVTCVVFQNDNLLASAGAVDGCVKVWDVRKIKPDNTEAVYSFPYTGISKRTHGFSSLSFDSYYSRLFASCTDDIIYCYNFTNYNPQPVCTYRGHRNNSFYVRAVVSPDNQFLLSGSIDENAYIWQVDKPNSSPIILKGHRSEISDVAWCYTDLFRLVTTSDDNTMRVWRYDPTADLRKQMGKSDVGCNIIGTAERTHRDIGVSAESAPQTPKHSPHASLKRAATVPFGNVTELTPKRAKTPSTATPSPSIKMWLKRSSSDSTASPRSGASSGSIEPKRLKLNPIESKYDRLSGAEVDANISIKQDVKSCSKMGHVSDTVIKDNESETNDRITKASKNGNLTKTQKSCKRKLVDCENSPEKISKRKKVEDNNRDETMARLESPRKRDTILKDLDSQANASPEKRENQDLDYYSPARVRVLDLGTKNCVQSPTSNLPNLIVDGPSISQNKTFSEEVNKKKTVDWLTQMRIQKLANRSPQTKVCNRKLLDKLNQSENSSALGNSSSALSPKSKSPSRGVKAISSFFRRPTTNP